MKTFRFLSLLVLVLVSTQISFATEPVEALARKAVSGNTAAIEELRALQVNTPPQCQYLGQPVWKP